MTPLPIESTQPFRVCLDPGHPSELSSGAEGNGIKEVEYVWDIAQIITEQTENSQIEIKLTKTTLEEKVSNKERSKRSNQYSSDLLVRLHLDDTSYSGFDVYYPDKSAHFDGELLPGATVVLKSSRAAKKIFSEMSKGLSKYEYHPRSKEPLPDSQTYVGKQPKSKGLLIGSRYSKCPTVLIEMGSIGNLSDVTWLKSREHKAKMANAILSAILETTKMLRAYSHS